VLPLAIVRREIMLHATIRSHGEALHFIAELDHYNLQTLRQHLQGALADRGSAELHVRIDADQRRDWEKRTQRWLSRLVQAGVPIHVEAVAPPGRP
jgi:uncharacterized protein (DUF2267 family)